MSNEQSYAVTFDKPGMMPVIWRAANLSEALEIISMGGNQSRIKRGYSATISEWVK